MGGSSHLFQEALQKTPGTSFPVLHSLLYIPGFGCTTWGDVSHHSPAQFVTWNTVVFAQFAQPLPPGQESKV